MASENAIYETGEDRKPDWREAAAAYDEEGTVAIPESYCTYGACGRNVAYLLCAPNGGVINN